MVDQVEVNESTRGERDRWQKLAVNGKGYLVYEGVVSVTSFVQLLLFLY